MQDNFQRASYQSSDVAVDCCQTILTGSCLRHQIRFKSEFSPPIHHVRMNSNFRGPCIVRQCECVKLDAREKCNVRLLCMNRKLSSITKRQRKRTQFSKALGDASLSLHMKISLPCDSDTPLRTPKISA